MWLKSKSSLNRERKKLVLTSVHRAACFLHGIDCGGLWYCWLALLPCESLLKDSKRKGNRKCESEETAEWGRDSYHRGKGLASFPWSRGAAWRPWTSQGVSVCVFVLQPIDLHLYMWAFLFSCLVLVRFACSLGRPFGISILALYHSSLTWEPSLFGFCSEGSWISWISSCFLLNFIFRNVPSLVS